MHEIDEEIARRELEPTSQLEAMIERGEVKLIKDRNEKMRLCELREREIAERWKNVLLFGKKHLSPYVNEYLYIDFTEHLPYEDPPDELSQVQFVLAIQGLKTISVRFDGVTPAYTVNFKDVTFPFTDIEMALAKAKELGG
jgi:hypothetical protein